MTPSSAAGNRRIAVIVAHPDDEVLGCGGTIRRHTLAGDEVWAIILADGETSRDAAGEKAIAGREAAMQAAAKILGVQHCVAHRLPDNRLDTVPLLDLIKLVERHIRDIAPAAVYTHHGGDLNVDHRRVHQAVMTACRPQPGQSVTRLLCFETPSSTEWQSAPGEAPFVPNWFVDISDVLETKMQALRAYGHEMKPWPHPRSYEAVEHLARWRGATIGCAAAEAFIIGREIWRNDS
jgi:LmbE family N-acetylglucosaminyl deacetylase